MSRPRLNVLTGPVPERFDAIVVGGGHAGIEAAAAVSRRGGRVVLVTLSAAKIGALSCNPAVGGVAKGHLVREVDALGGVMGLAIDATGIQFRMLNTSKGYAVRSPRAQADRALYPAWIQEFFAQDSNVAVVEGELTDLLTDGGAITGARLSDGRALNSPCVVLCTGTFLGGLMHMGTAQTPGGRRGEPAPSALTRSLHAVGVATGRHKTGTPPRIDGTTVDWTRVTEQPSDEGDWHFSFDHRSVRGSPQVSCWATTTTAETHRIIRENIHLAPMYSGQITARGPRYCPSIEDKVMRFADREAHQVMLEPEGLDTDELYCNGISTSLPPEIQERVVRSIPALEKARITQYGYAVEYDYVPPSQTQHTLESRAVRGLFFAGQINGTSGYEEAAGQGLVAGANAFSRARGLPPFVVRRDQAYIGVMIDDLITRCGDEPYRMFTSRSEHRLLLRQDNADRRLGPLAWEHGMLPADRKSRLDAKVSAIAALRGWCDAVRLPGSGRTVAQRLRAPDATAAGVCEEATAAGLALPSPAPDALTWEAVEIDVKYEGYLARLDADIARQVRYERWVIPESFDFAAIRALRAESREKLLKFRPPTLGVAGRIPGVTAADLSLLAVHLRAHQPAPVAE